LSGAAWNIPVKKNAAFTHWLWHSSALKRTFWPTMSDPWASGVGQTGNIGASRVVPPPADLPAFPEAKKAKPKTPRPGGGKRTRWHDSGTGVIYEWDYQHGHVEAYDARGNHLGAFDHETGRRTKPADLTRRVTP
jgi:hypothetical protein